MQLKDHAVQTTPVAGEPAETRNAAFMACNPETKRLITPAGYRKWVLDVVDESGLPVEQQCEILREALRLLEGEKSDGEPITHETILRRCSASIRPVVEWFFGLPPAARLAGVLLQSLLVEDTQEAFRNQKAYDGRIGHDLYRVFCDEVEAMGICGGLPESSIVAFLAGVEANCV